MSRVLVIQAESRFLNPLLDQERIDADIDADAEAGSSEWLGIFRSSTTQYLPDEDIDRAIVPGRKALPKLDSGNYIAFCDPSGGRHDAMTLGIAHQQEDKRVVLDVLLIQQPPFDPETVTKGFAACLKSYGLSRVEGDRYGAAWVQSAFAKHGVRYEASELDKSAIYIESLPLFTQGRVELLDIPILITQLRLLERRPRPGGRGDLVDHPPRSADDASNAAVGALLLASKRAPKGTQIQVIQHPAPRWNPHDGLAASANHFGPPSKVYRPPPAKVAEALRGELALLVAERQQAELRGADGARAVARLDRRIEQMRARLAAVEEKAA